MAYIKTTLGLEAVAGGEKEIAKLENRIKSLYKSSDGAKAEVAKGVEGLEKSYRQSAAGVQALETKLKEAGVSGKQYAATMGTVRTALAEAKAHLDAASSAATLNYKNVGDLSAHYRTARTSVNALAKELDVAAKSTDKLSSSQGGLAGQLTKIVSVTAIAYAAWRQFKDSVEKGLEFDKSLTSLGLSGMSQSGGLTPAREQLRAISNGAAGGMFDSQEILSSLEAFRDSPEVLFGRDPSEVVEQLLPLRDAATATMQDLASVTDTMDAAMDHFNMSFEETGRVASVVTVAFQEAGVSATGMTQAIIGAGSAARVAGATIESYAAIVTRLKALGFDEGVATAFQKRLTATMLAPSAKQLKALSDAGTSMYVTDATPYDAAAAAAERLTARGGRIGGVIGGAITSVGGGVSSELRQSAETVRATKEAADRMVDMQRQSDAAGISVRSYGALAKGAAEDLKHLQSAQGMFKDQLDETTSALTKAKEKMADVRSQIQALANPRLTGMDAMDDEIAALELAAKKEELQALRNADATATFGDALKDASSHASTLKERLTELRAAEASSAKPFNDEAFKIQQEIKRLELSKLQLAPWQLFESNALSQQIARRQREFQIVNLKRDLAVDPITKQISDAQDIEKGGSTRAQQLRDEAAEKRLERDVRYGDALLKIQQENREMQQRIGLMPDEQSAGDVLASIPALESQFRSIDASVASLTEKQATIASVVDGYDDAISDSAATMDGYKSAADEAAKKQEDLNAALTIAEEKFAGMPKILKDQDQLLRDIASSGMVASLSYTLMGNRMGATMVALLGEKGERVDQLERLNKAMKEMTPEKVGATAGEVERTPWGQSEVLKAKIEELKIEAGTAVINVLGNHPTQTTPGDAVGSPIDSSSQFVQDLWWLMTGANGPAPQHFKQADGRATGGVIPGIGGYGDTVPAMLTPGEEVLRRDDPRHAFNGGRTGSITINVNNPVVRSDADIDAIAQKVSRALYESHRRAAAGMPA